MKKIKTPIMNKKMTFNYLGMTFELPANALQTDRWDNTKYIYMGAKHTASIIKQYVKKKYGTRITVWATSDVYSGGSSVRINVWSKNGSATPLSIYQDINNFSNSLKAGRFDGMTDCYEYSDEVVSSDNGTKLKYFPSYIFVENRPKWDSVEYWLNEWKNWDETQWSTPAIGNNDWEKFVNRNKSYWKKGTLENLTKYMVQLEKELTKLGYTKEELMEII
jgi:hypothetical protein